MVVVRTANDMEENSSITEGLPQNEPVEHLRHEPEEDSLHIEEGPFQSHPLIQNLAKELEYVQFEAFDQNIYLGTSTGDLLHYYEIEPCNYMLVSQTQFDQESRDPIDKIVLLPNVERALVLCHNTLVLFLLPEFAPAPNTSKLNGIVDIALRGYSESSKSYKFYAAHKDSIKLLRVSMNTITLSKNYDFKPVDKLCAHGHHLAVAKRNSYEIINLRTSKVTPLFRVSETTAPLAPVISDFNKQEFLVATGGGSYQDSSMALIVNHNGDIVNGTIVLENYPMDVLVDYPYIIVNFELSRLCIYKLNDEPRIVQEIKVKSPSLRIARTSKIFGDFKRIEVKERVVDKLRKVSLIKGANQLKIDNEREFIEQIFEEGSSLVMYGKIGIYVLIKRSPILDFVQYGEPEINAIEGYLMEYKNSSLSKYKLIENDYLFTLMLLLILLHCKNINDAVVSKWCSAFELVDIRLLLYILGFEIYGNIWIFNGLIELVEKLKSLKLIHKCNDTVKLLQLIRHELIQGKNKRTAAEFEGAIRTVDVSIFRLQMRANKEDIDINAFDECSLEEISRSIEDTSEDHLDLLLRVNQRRGMLNESIELLKVKKDARRLLNFIEQNVNELPSSYAQSKLTDDLLFIINNFKTVDKALIARIFKILSLVETDPRKLLNQIEENPVVKVLVIEQMGAENFNDKRFLIDYYMAKLQETMQSGNLWDLFAQFTSEYSQDKTYSKCSVTEYLVIKLKNNESCEEFLKCYESVKTLCQQHDDNNLTNSVISIVKSFDIGHLLTLLFLSDNQSATDYLTEDELLEIYMAFNDFMSVEKYLNEKSILKVLRHYTSFEKIQHSTNLATKLLERNSSLIRKEDTLLSVLRDLPTEFVFSTLFKFLFCIVKRLDGERKESELQKALLKNEISAYDRTLKALGVEEETSR